MNEVIYIAKKYLKKEENMHVRIDFPDDTLAEIWNSYNWEEAKVTLFSLQCKLSKLSYAKNIPQIRKVQDKITSSSEARMLAVKKVSEESLTMAGIDGVRWRSSSEKMRAAISLTDIDYHAQPYVYCTFTDEKCQRIRELGVPTMYDRAMQVLYSYALEPVAEAWADRKSFSARKGRSVYAAHATLCKALEDYETGEWLLVADIQAYYDTIAHNWLVKHVPMNKNVLKEFLKCGISLNDGDMEWPDEGISLGCNISPILGNMALDGLQQELYKPQKGKIDYKNGWCLRFADDIIVLAKSQKDAKRFKEILKNFALKRGFRINESKTKIVNISKGFEFLSRVYIKNQGILQTIPSERAVKNFENSLTTFILKNDENWSQRKLIKQLNIKLRRMGCIS